MKYAAEKCNKNRIKTGCSILINLICILLACSLCVNTVLASEQNMTDRILKWKCTEAQADDAQQLLHGFCTENVSSGVVQSYVMGMLQEHPELDYSTFGAALRESLNAPETYSEVSLQKAVLVSILLGQCDEEIYMACLRDTVGTKGIMSYVYGLMVLEAWQDSLNQNAEDSAELEQSILLALIECRLPDGGYAVTGSEGDIDVTAMVLQAYAAYLKQHLPEGKSLLYEDTSDILSVDTALQDIQSDGFVSVTELQWMLNESLEFLSDSQLATGDYESYHNRNLESTAQVLLALDALGINTDLDTDFIKNGITLTEVMSRYQLEDGSFCHTPEGHSDDMASAQAYQALVSHRQSCQQSGSATTVTEQKAGTVDYRLPVSYMILLLGGIYLIVSRLRKKRMKNRMAGCLLAVVVGIVAVWRLQIQSVQDYYRTENGAEQAAQENQILVTLSIRCDTVAGKKEDIPADGILLADSVFYVEEGTTVFQVLQMAVKQYSIQMEYEGTSDTYAYVEGIAYLYEFDFGELSGWMYLVNGQQPGVGCGGYQVQDQDEIVFAYTCDIGKDLPMYEENE